MKRTAGREVLFEAETEDTQKTKEQLIREMVRLGQRLENDESEQGGSGEAGAELGNFLLRPSALPAWEVGLWEFAVSAPLDHS